VVPPVYGKTRTLSARSWCIGPTRPGRAGAPKPRMQFLWYEPLTQLIGSEPRTRLLPSRLRLRSGGTTENYYSRLIQRTYGAPTHTATAEAISSSSLEFLKPITQLGVLTATDSHQVAVPLGEHLLQVVLADHATITDKHHALEVEAVSQIAQYFHDSCCIAAVTFPDMVGDRPAGQPQTAEKSRREHRPPPVGQVGM